MYKVRALKDNGCKYLELISSDQESRARISLNEGGRLQELKFENVFIIKDNPLLKYNNTFASSILFPFANRIKEGKYNFNEKDYQLDCNEKDRNNAIHGLVFNKKFDIINKTISSTFSEVSLLYKETKPVSGFPFCFDVLLTYRLSDKELSLTVSIKNTDKLTFPFTLGWHPYFISENLQKSSLDFNSYSKVKLDQSLITVDVLDNFLEIPVKIKDNLLDDCYVLKNNTVKLETPTYMILVQIINNEENYLQLYKPKNSRMIAIEPMTGVSDSFNNKIGLQQLEPNKEYKTKWNLNFKKNQSN